MQKGIQFVRHDANAPKGRSKSISFTKGKGKALDPRLFTCTPLCSEKKNRLVERHWSPLQGQQAKETCICKGHCFWGDLQNIGVGQNSYAAYGPSESTISHTK
jgi:hypothetical protein